MIATRRLASLDGPDMKPARGKRVLCSTASKQAFGARDQMTDDGNCADDRSHDSVYSAADELEKQSKDANSHQSKAFTVEYANSTHCSTYSSKSITATAYLDLRAPEHRVAKVAGGFVDGRQHSLHLFLLYLATLLSVTKLERDWRSTGKAGRIAVNVTPTGAGPR